MKISCAVKAWESRAGQVKLEREVGGGGGGVAGIEGALGDGRRRRRGGSPLISGRSEH